MPIFLQNIVVDIILSHICSNFSNKKLTVWETYQWFDTKIMACTDNINI